MQFDVWPGLTARQLKTLDMGLQDHAIEVQSGSDHELELRRPDPSSMNATSLRNLHFCLKVTS
jgi:hypothetical protein